MKKRLEAIIFVLLGRAHIRGVHGGGIKQFFVIKIMG